MNSVSIVDINNNNSFAGWWMVVFYQLATEPLRNLTLFDGFDPVNNVYPQNLTLSGFSVPADFGAAKLGIVAFEGDNSILGDSFSFGAVPSLSDGNNPETNFFNGTHSFLGTPLSTLGDLPQLTGEPQSMSGIDLDVVDVTSKLTAGQTSVPISATSTGDVYYLAGFVTSIPSSSYCGNGLINVGEACDDGNTVSSDGCDASCLFELGHGCVTASVCGSGSCTDGVCCDSPCAGPCQACSTQAKGGVGFDGQCEPFANGTDPENDCNMDPTSTCQQDGVCDGNGACRLWASGTLCSPDTCFVNTSKHSICSGLGACQLDPIGIDCGANGCDPATGQCISQCTKSADCTADAYCDASTSQCQPKAPLGTVCTASEQCQSGHCVDDVCCNDACDGLCRACNADGICSAGAEDLACAADPMNPCGNTGQCTDVGTCAFATNGTVCATPSCSDGIAQTSSCDGNGTCVATTTPCGNYACDAAACKTSCSSNQDCNKDAYCDQAQCKSRAIIASVCSVDQECKSEHCVEAADVDPDAGPLKICCEAPCKDDPDNECGQTGRCTVTGECEVEPLGKKCGSAGCSNDGHRYGRQICASGKCVPDPSVDVDCSPYPCESALSCKSSCNSDAECLSEYECRKGRCGIKTCDENRKCLDGETCDPNTKMCISASADSDGCTCQTPGSHSLNSRWPAMFVALALLMLRRVQSPHFFSRRES